MKKLFKTIKNITERGKIMMINFYAMQILEDWITIEQVPKRFRKRVQELVKLSETGLDKE
ncbi:hypothetical protein BU200_01200 [Streptococcus acidominimus]|nr:hypothetical protein BU200_01200 [Streptococcus acidominimus]